MIYYRLTSAETGLYLGVRESSPSNIVGGFSLDEVSEPRNNIHVVWVIPQRLDGAQTGAIDALIRSQTFRLANGYEKIEVDGRIYDVLTVGNSPDGDSLRFTVSKHHNGFYTIQPANDRKAYLSIPPGQVAPHPRVICGHKLFYWKLELNT
uniref:hypothetical protein n=1 Tax=Photorhabdus sp. RM322S TaxID=3342825 RepID=UPI0036DB4090